MFQKLLQTVLTSAVSKTVETAQTRNTANTLAYAFQTTLPPARQWAILAGGKLARLNQDTLVSLQNKFPPEEMQRVLREWWSVNNREEVVSTLDWLEGEGHRVEFEPVFQKIAPLTQAQAESLAVQNPDKAQIIRFIWENRGRFANGSLLSWDLGRLINICRFGFSAGYIPEDYAWQRILPAARALQASHQSWLHLFENYDLGYQFWQGGSALPAKEFAATQWLTTSPESPCLFVPWGLPLAG